ncbi:MAG: divalent metal cation transporter [Patescibacteria group bacterium]|jgi:NRAMP (natural resistance-associated macrophage protein)-like metal ion transporter
MDEKPKEPMIERIAEAPAEVLEKTVEISSKVEHAVVDHGPIKTTRDFWHKLGPGLTTGAADDDPSGITTYSQTGAQYGFGLLWLAAFTFPLMAIVQEMCARIGMVTGQGLAANIRHHFPKSIIYICAVLLFAANTFNIGADLGAMAQATQLLAPKASFGLLVVGFTVLCLLMQVFLSYATYAKYLKWMALVLFAYVFSAIAVGLNWNDVILHTVKPSLNFSKEQIILICGILGTTISPYLFFWQTSQEVEEQILTGHTSIKSRQSEVNDAEIKDMRIDIWSGMFLSNIAMFFIIAACAATLFQNGINNIGSAADAAEALRPIAGNGAFWLFAIGILGVGLLGIPVLAGSASYAISESMGWRQGLYRKLTSAYAFYGVMIIAMLLGLSMNFIGLDPIKVLIYSAVANGLVAPVILVLIVLIGSNKKIMGSRVNHPVTTFFGWLVTAVMVVAGLATIYSFF